MSRSFTVEQIKIGKKTYSPEDGGRYISDTPSSAAKKAYSKFCEKGKCKIVMRETTSGSQKKTYAYNSKRVKDPVEVMHGKVAVVHNYRTEVKSCKK